MESATIGQRIKQVREDVPLSQRELATAVGVSSAQLSRIENGHSMPRPLTIRNIADALGVRWGWLAKGTGDMRDG